MPANTQKPVTSVLWNDLALVAFLIGLDVVARLLPHAPGFVPIAASALFAGRVLKIPALAVVVPLLAMAISDALLPPESLRTALVIYVALAIPALVGMLSRRLNGPIVIGGLVLACSLLFFVTTNFAVWAFGTLYPHSLEGLTQCYIAALPFLDKTVMGDLFWAGALFGGAWVIQNGAMLAGRAR